MHSLLRKLGLKAYRVKPNFDRLIQFQFKRKGTNINILFSQKKKFFLNLSVKFQHVCEGPTICSTGIFQYLNNTKIKYIKIKYVFKTHPKTTLQIHHLSHFLDLIAIYKGNAGIIVISQLSWRQLICEIDGRSNKRFSLLCF